jgi:hypothetical protein
MKKRIAIKKLSRIMDAKLHNMDLSLAEKSGCCVIKYFGATIKRDGYKESECKALANNFPEADWHFFPGECTA